MSIECKKISLKRIRKDELTATFTRKPYRLYRYSIHVGSFIIRKGAVFQISNKYLIVKRRSLKYDR